MSNKTIIRPQKGFQEQFTRANVDFVVGGGCLNAGKQTPLYTKVLTPYGWVKNGDLKVGDYVCTPFDKPSKVLGIYPQGVHDIFELETYDGRICESGYEHLWCVRTKKQVSLYNEHKEHKDFLILTTKELIKKLNNGEELYIPTPQKQEFFEKEYVIPPYVMGVLLCCLIKEGKDFFNEDTFCIQSFEKEVVENVAQMCSAYKVDSLQNGLNYIHTNNSSRYNEYMKSVDFEGRFDFSCIPSEYLFGSSKQRLELLCGIFDSIGYIDSKNRLYVKTISKKLKDDIMSLCRSLGYVCECDIRMDDVAKVCYRILINTCDIIFTTKSHFSNYKEQSCGDYDIYNNCKNHVKIKSIRKKGKTEMQCIYIENEKHLYIIDDFITTHNTFAAVLAVAEPALDGNFNALFLRNNLGDLKSGGGILDTFREVYGDSVKIVESGEPRVIFPSGAKVDVTHVADQNRDKIRQRFKGRQYDFIYFDEGTGFIWDCFTEIYSRNRGSASWTGHVMMTTNPEREHWLRTFLDWYIGADGFIREDRNGVIRYFYMAGETVNDVVWGNSKEEVYAQCKQQIDRTLSKVNGKEGKANWGQLIKSFTFYLGRMSENKASVTNNKNYVGSVAMTGGRNAQQLLEGNWNVSLKDDSNALISVDEANYVFFNDPQINNDRWITADLADTGTDNFLAIAWDGFHVIDILILNHSTPRLNAEALHIFAVEHDVSDSHIIYDAIRGTYINDYIPDARQFVSYRAPVGLYARMFQKLKDECYGRLVEVIKNRNMSFSEKVRTKIYEHQMLNNSSTIQSEFVEECSVVRFRDMPSGKKTLFSKREMNQKLGKSRSMDLLDPCAMRMLPVLEYPYGEELTKTQLCKDEEEKIYYSNNSVNIFDETFWN